MREVEVGKKEYIYTKEVDPGKLMEEFYEAIPELTPIFSEEGIEVHLRVFTNGSTLTLWVDEAIPKDSVDVVVYTHIPEEPIIEEEGEIDAISSDTE